MTAAERKARDEARCAGLAAFDLAMAEREGVLIAGIDEAGRGPLFGPVYAACVVLWAGQAIAGVNDSKQMTEKAREKLLPVIRAESVAVGVGSADEAEITLLGILSATHLAMGRAADEAMRLTFEATGEKPALFLVDGKDAPELPAAIHCVEKGDSLSMAVASASIVAKVSRDALIRELDALYPGYGLAKHKGYGTAEHVRALRALGATPRHRASYVATILANKALPKKKEAAR